MKAQLARVEEQRSVQLRRACQRLNDKTHRRGDGLPRAQCAGRDGESDGLGLANLVSCELRYVHNQVCRIEPPQIGGHETG